MFCLIVSFDSPASRSRKVIGTSRTRVQRQRTISSSPILNPFVLMPAAAPRASVSLDRQKKPDMGSDEPDRGTARRVAPWEMARRKSDHSKPTPPPPTLRDPTAKSASPSRTGLATAGTASGSCCKSASMHKTTGAAAAPKPFSTADASPRPSPRLRARSCTSNPSAASAATAAAVAAEPGDSSSATMSSARTHALRVAANRRRVRGSMLGASSNAGTTTDSSSCWPMVCNSRVVPRRPPP
mmetsp:Transcript_36927/g.109867  ORF Transcript_36927/g.109867 Transcript_36927/m.109867 type:complete len:241 (-) Transcript_36927:24-746(-)